MTLRRNAPDPITLEIIFNALRSVTDETFIALMKSAYSTNIKERRDHSTALVDANGRLVVQADASLPIHVASMTGLMRSLLRKFAGRIEEGDIFVANDPHVAGGTHLPDVNLAMPVFDKGELIGFVCNIAHHADIGGMAPGSMAGGMSEIYQEGLRIPVVRLFRRGELQQDLLDLFLLNVRLPEERRGDYFAQIAACRLGERRFREILAEHGRDTVTTAFDEIIERTGRRLREGIGEIPDGTYRFEDVMDDDGMGSVDMPIRLEVLVEGERIRFDFTGTSPQVLGNVNVTFNATQSAVCYALKALLDPQIPNNEGALRVPEIVVPEGTLLNAVFPAPVAARAHTCQRIIDVVLGALAPALPERSVGAANGANTTAVFAGTDPRTGRGYLYLETMGGGFGGRATKDGKDGVQVHITNTSNLPVEAIEMEYPLFVEEYGLVEDSGGAGRHRGGMGIRRTISPVGHACTFNGAGERFRHQPWGVFGGAPGRSGRFLHVAASGETRALPVKPAGIRLEAGERVIIDSPGAGGYGRPAERDPEALREDAASGKFSAEYRARHYGAGTRKKNA
jgi:N-methylhydantoinase B